MLCKRGCTVIGAKLHFLGRRRSEKVDGVQLEKLFSKVKINESKMDEKYYANIHCRAN